MNSTAKQRPRFNILQDAILTKDENGNYKIYTEHDLLMIVPPPCNIRNFMEVICCYEAWSNFSRSWPKNVKVKFDSEAGTYQAYEF